MKRQIPLILTLLVCTLLLAGATVAQSGGSDLDNAVTLSGGHYRLVSLAGSVDIIAGGGGYMLWGLSTPELRGSGCCCTYLPCVLRSSP